MFAALLIACTSAPPEPSVVIQPSPQPVPADADADADADSDADTDTDADSDSDADADADTDTDADSDSDTDADTDADADTDNLFCRNVPTDEDGACWHTFGGRYADGACSGAYQCCDGAFEAQGSCGACSCTEASGHDGCVPDTAGTEVCFDPYTHTVEPLPQSLRDQMLNTTYEPGCPVGLDDLSLITTAHWGFDGLPATGQIVVKADLAPVYVDVFQHAWEMQFPIERMEPASVHGGSDDASMAVNNTSAFNCRAVTGGSSWSQHSYGHAIDINPRQNPYVSSSGNTVLPPEGQPYVTPRDESVPGLITEPGPIYGAFRRHDWGWGGNWSSLKDYQHFSENGL